MSSQKKEKSEAGLVFVGISALMMAGFGAMLGFIYLMSFPLKEFSSMGERVEALEARESTEAIPGDAFYIEGPILRSSSWENKRQQFLDGNVSTIKVTAGEINAFLERKFRSSAVPVDEDHAGLMIEPEAPNIGISGEKATFLNLPARIKGYGLDGSYVFSAKVRFSRSSPPGLSVDRLQIGGAAVPLPGILGKAVVSSIRRAFSSAEEYQVISSAWSVVQSVEVVDGALILTLVRP